jgi:hypothetical protein
MLRLENTDKISHDKINSARCFFVKQMPSRKNPQEPAGRMFGTRKLHEKREAGQPPKFYKLGMLAEE